MKPADEDKKTTTLERAIADFYIAKRAERLSENTLNDYRITLRRFTEYIGADRPFAKIESGNVASFLADLPVSKKTVLNAHVALSSLWTWAVMNGIASDHIVRRVPKPRPDMTLIKPFEQDDIRRLLGALDKDAERNRAILLFLLDTGVRASELTSLTLGDLRGETVIVKGKGGKIREIPLSSSTLRALLDYLALRRGVGKKSPLFAVKSGGPMNRHLLRRWMSNLGDRAGVPDSHPHRFRHTFAVNYLRNGGDAISLQSLLGHSTLDMVKHYVSLATGDLKAIHRRASPVDNWKL